MNKILSISLLACVFICSCQPRINSRGNLVFAEKMSGFVVGKTKKIDIFNACGTPSLQNGKYIWIYVGGKAEDVAFRNTKIADKLVVRLTFDEKDILRKIEKVAEKEMKTLDDDFTELVKR